MVHRRLGIGIETYLIIPTTQPDAARSVLGDDEVVQEGEDFVALYCGERFTDVRQDPQHWGPVYIAALPVPLRRRLDPRGLLALAAIDSSFEHDTYDDLATDPEGVWLPLRPVAARARQRHILLIPLSSARAKLLVEEPDLAGDLVEARHDQPVPGALELGPVWVGLQRALLELAHGADEDSCAARVLPPARGMLLYESKTVDAARIVDASTVSELARWIEKIPSEALADLDVSNLTSPAAQAFPASLGTAPADDRDPPPDDRAPSDSGALTEALDRVRSFYREARSRGHGLVAIRFRVASFR